MELPFVFYILIIPAAIATYVKINQVNAKEAGDGIGKTIGQRLLTNLWVISFAALAAAITLLLLSFTHDLKIYRYRRDSVPPAQEREIRGDETVYLQHREK